MKFNHIVLTITEFITFSGAHYICSLFTDNGKTHTFTEPDIDEARKIQWELLAKGAKKTTAYNPFSPHVFTREIRLLEIDGWC